MTDFYAVLKKSIVKRDLRSPDDRLEVYAQAREAMIKRLWSFDPPLAEDEIDTRIGLFDTAVEKIEEDLERAYAERQATAKGPTEAPVVKPPSLYPTRPDRPVNDHLAYAPAFDGLENPEAATEPASDEEIFSHRARPANAPPRRQAAGNAKGLSVARAADEPLATAYDAEVRHSRIAEDEWPPVAYPPDEGPELAASRTLYDRQWEAEEEAETDYPVLEDYAERRPRRPERGPQVRSSAERWPDDRNSRFTDGNEYDGEPDYPPLTVSYDESSGYEDDGYEDDGYGQAAHERHRQPPRAERRIPARRRPDRWSESSDEGDDFDRPGRAGFSLPFARGTLRAGQSWIDVGLAEIKRHDPVRLLTWIIIGLAAILILFNAYVFLPLLFDSSAPPSAAEPMKVDDRLPAAALPQNTETRIVSDNATAIEIPQRNLNVAETLVVFDGRDPTVFDAAPGNPVQFDSDAEGGFTRISSSSSSAGARAVIGPGLAARLAGRTIRVTLLARSSAENGADTMRFAYQSGVAISHWQSADISADYGSYGIIWRVPAIRTNAAGDYLVIEPGIPGGGTSADVRSIKIDILAS